MVRSIIITIIKYASQIAQLLENAFPICICIAFPGQRRRERWEIHLNCRQSSPIQHIIFTLALTCTCKCMFTRRICTTDLVFVLHLNKIIALNASLCDNIVRMEARECVCRACPLNLDAKFAYCIFNDSSENCDRTTLTAACI